MYYILILAESTRTHVVDNGFLSEASDLCAHVVLVTKPRRGPEVGVPGHVTIHDQNQSGS
jgi:hypothetical protein